MKKQIVSLKNKLFLTLLGALTIALCGCSNDSPAYIQKGIFRQMIQGDYEKAVDRWYSHVQTGGETTPEMRENLRNEKKILSDGIKYVMDKRGGLASAELSSETISQDGNYTTVIYKLIYKDGTSETMSNEYYKVDGKWKVDPASF